VNGFQLNDGELPIRKGLKAEIEKANSEIKRYADQKRMYPGRNLYLATNSRPDYTQQPQKDEREEQLQRTAIALYDKKSTKTLLEFSEFACILSFNYTNTFKRLYGSNNTKYCYIHGEAQADATETNIVLGIDDSLTRDRASKEFDWVKFKKYYQRIHFKTGSEYKDWIKDFRQKSEHADVHVVGHSLDETDHDVFREFMSRNDCRTIIYYWNDQDHNSKIEQAIRIVGKDELIKKVHGSNWTIRFVDLYGPEGLFHESAKPQ